MSEPPPKREWRFYLDDMIAFTERVVDYTRGLDQAGFESSAITYDATLRNLELVGEAAIRVPQSVREVSTQIPRQYSGSNAIRFFAFPIPSKSHVRESNGTSVRVLHRDRQHEAEEASKP